MFLLQNFSLKTSKTFFEEIAVCLVSFWVITLINFNTSNNMFKEKESEKKLNKINLTKLKWIIKLVVQIF